MNASESGGLAAFLSSDISKLPLSALQSIQQAVREEIVARRRREQISKVDARDAGDALAKLQKLPKPHHQYNHHWLPYLDSLLQQDWSILFPEGDPEPRYYVYAHIRPSGKATRFVGHGLSMRFKGLPFYIGKGTGDRAFDMKRNQGHGATLRELLDQGHTPNDLAHIISGRMPEAKALEMESKLIYFFGTKYEPNRRGILVNLDIPPRPF